MKDLMCNNRALQEKYRNGPTTPIVTKAEKDAAKF